MGNLQGIIRVSLLKTNSFESIGLLSDLILMWAEKLSKQTIQNLTLNSSFDAPLQNDLICT